MERNVSRYKTQGAFSKGGVVRRFQVELYIVEMAGPDLTRRQFLGGNTLVH